MCICARALSLCRQPGTLLWQHHVCTFSIFVYMSMFLSGTDNFLGGSTCVLSEIRAFMCLCSLFQGTHDVFAVFAGITCVLSECVRTGLMVGFGTSDQILLSICTRIICLRCHDGNPQSLHRTSPKRLVAPRFRLNFFFHSLPKKIFPLRFEDDRESSTLGVSGSCLISDPTPNSRSAETRHHSPDDVFPCFRFRMT